MRHSDLNGGKLRIILDWHSQEEQSQTQDVCIILRYAGWGVDPNYWTWDLASNIPHALVQCEIIRLLWRDKWSLFNQITGKTQASVEFDWLAGHENQQFFIDAHDTS